MPPPQWSFLFPLCVYRYAQFVHITQICCRTKKADLHNQIFVVLFAHWIATQQKYQHRRAAALGLKQCTLHHQPETPRLPLRPHTLHILSVSCVTTVPLCSQKEKAGNGWHAFTETGSEETYEDCRRGQDNPEARFTLHFTSAIQSCSTGHNWITSVTFTVQYECVTDERFLYFVLYFLMLAQIKTGHILELHRRRSVSHCFPKTCSVTGTLCWGFCSVRAGSDATSHQTDVESCRFS